MTYELDHWDLPFHQPHPWTTDPLTGLHYPVDRQRFPAWWTEDDDLDVRALVELQHHAVPDAEDERSAIVRASMMLTWGHQPALVAALLAEWHERQCRDVINRMAVRRLR